MSLRTSISLHRPVKSFAQYCQRALISTTEHTQQVVERGPKNDYLRLIFDDQRVWAEHQRLSASAKSTGLFGNEYFTDSAGFNVAVQKTIQRAHMITERICNAPRNGPEEMRRVVKNLDRLSDALCSVIDMAEFLRNAYPKENIMETANSAYANLCSYMNTLNTDTRLHAVLSQVMKDPSIVSKFSADEHAAAVVFLRDFEKSGIHLSTKQRRQFVELSDKIIQLGRDFIQNSPHSTSFVQFKKDALTGLPPLTVRSLMTRGDDVFIPTDAKECHLIFKYAKNSQTRQQMYAASNSASDGSIHTLESLLNTRAQLADLVGRQSFAELQLLDKMAKHPNNVDAFLRTLLKHQAPEAQADLNLLREAKQRDLGLTTPPTVYAWDREYYIHQVTTDTGPTHPSILETPYITIGSAIEGLSSLFCHLYGIRFEPASIRPGESWHPDVRKLDVVCEDQGKIGTIYCDLFGRVGKTTHAAHYTVRTSRRVDDDDADNDARFASIQDNSHAGHDQAPVSILAETIRGRHGLFQLPVVALTCDFSRVAGRETAFLSMPDVETLFHEMGHAIHSMLGCTDFHNVAGTRCATDFVELPSILMEHFVWHPAVISLFTRNSSASTSFTPEAIEAYRRQRRRFGSIELNSQILMAMLDLQYHSVQANQGGFSSRSTWYALQDEVGLFPSVPGTMWPVRFGHLFGYAASYYSYLFDRTLARRIWQTCFASNPLDRTQGQAFREGLLRWGGARDPWQCIADVLGGEDGSKIAAGDEQAMRTVGDWGIDV